MDFNIMPTKGKPYWTPIYDETKDQFGPYCYMWNGDRVDQVFFKARILYDTKEDCLKVCTARNKALDLFSNRKLK